MRQQYWEARIAEALRATGHDEARATRLVLGWAAEDLPLLLGLTRPHLNGIVAYAVGRVARRKEAPPPPPPAAAPSFDDLPGEAFGKALLKAVAFGQPARFGREGLSAPPASTRPGASQRHIDAIRRIAAAGSMVPKPDETP